MKLVLALAMVFGACTREGSEPAPEPTPTPTPKPIPVIVDAGTPDAPVEEPPKTLTRNTIAIGMGYACARDAKARLVCWGARFSEKPEVVPGVSNVAAVVANQTVVCALTTTGTVFCKEGGPMAQIAGLDDVVELATDPDAFLTCARRKSGRVACWSSIGAKKQATDVTGVTGALEIAVGGSTACMRDKDGVACWAGGWVDANATAAIKRIPQAAGATRISGGRHKLGALIAGKPPIAWNEELEPFKLPSLPANVTQLVFGGDDACALSPAGVACWSAYTPNTIHDIPGLAGANEIAVADWVGCARMGAQLQCWGSAGSLGDGLPFRTDTPVTVANLTDATRIAIGGDRACARRAAGQIVCWGRGKDRNEPAPTTGLESQYDSKCSLAKCVAGVKREWHGMYQRGSWTCTKRASISCAMTYFGRGGETSTGPEESWGLIGDARDIRMPSNGSDQVCVANATGQVSCFAAFGGVSDPFSSDTVPGLDDVLELVQYGDETCALEKAGTVKCWNELERAARGAQVRTLPGITNAVEITGGDSHACARLATGQVRCWGLRTLLGDDVDRFQRTAKLVPNLTL